MSRIPDETIDEIRTRVDIIGLIGRYVDLKKAGRNHKGLCPFHGEKTPSFNVNPDKQIYHCFGCQAGGDAIGFLMAYEGLSFPEAVRSLAGELGIEIPEESSGERGLGEQIFAANEAAQAFYRASLASEEAEPARAYLAKRGLDAETIERTGIGYAPNRWEALVGELSRRKVDASIAEKAGLIAPGKSSGHYDRLRGRVVFPIHDVRRRIIGFGGRAIFEDQEPKYLNTPESPVFHKRQALYGFPAALEPIRRQERAIVCEGYFDRIALERAGLGEGLATCGTALTADHAQQLRRRTRRVVLLFDGDKAGQAAVAKALEVLLPEGLRVLAAPLPPGEDPDSFLAAQGAEALASLVDGARDALDGVFRRAMQRGCASPAQKADIVQDLSPLLARIPDAIERSEYTRRLGVSLDADPAAVEAAVRSASRGGAAGERTPQVDPATMGPAAPRHEPREVRHLSQLALLLYKHPELASDELRGRIEELVQAGQVRSVILELIAAPQRGYIDPSGVVSLQALEGELDEDAFRWLRGSVIDESLIENETPPEVMLKDFVQWLERRRRTAAKNDTTRRLRDPSEDPMALLAEKQRQLEARRNR